MEYARGVVGRGDGTTGRRVCVAGQQSCREDPLKFDAFRAWKTACRTFATGARRSAMVEEEVWKITHRSQRVVRRSDIATASPSQLPRLGSNAERLRWSLPSRRPKWGWRSALTLWGA